MQEDGVFTSASAAISRQTPGLIIPDGLAMKVTRCGKGLYATRAIEGQTILFKEQPLIWVPTIEVMATRINAGIICAYCGKRFHSVGHTLRVKCQGCNQGTPSENFIMAVWCSKTCAKKDECHTAENKYLTCPKPGSPWKKFLEFLCMGEQWNSGLAIGYLWSRIVCQSSGEAAELSVTSAFAETLASFSTISQEHRHEYLPDWYFPSFGAVNVGRLKRRWCGKCGGMHTNYSSLH